MDGSRRDTRPSGRVELGQQRLDSHERRGQVGVLVRGQAAANQSETPLHEAVAVGLGPFVDGQRVQTQLQCGEPVDQLRRSPGSSLHGVEQRRMWPSLHHLDRKVAELARTEDREDRRRRVVVRRRTTPGSRLHVARSAFATL